MKEKILSRLSDGFSVALMNGTYNALESEIKSLGFNCITQQDADRTYFLVIPILDANTSKPAPKKCCGKCAG